MRSVLRPDAEIVVVDDGSTDGVYERQLEISRDYNVRVYRLHGSSRGLGTTPFAGAQREARRPTSTSTTSTTSTSPGAETGDCHRAVGLPLNVELFDLMQVETSVGPEVVGATAKLASLIWSLAGNAELWSVVRRYSERTAIDLRPYRCTNGRYVLTASEKALGLAVSSFSAHGTSCVPVTGGPQNNNPAA